MKVQRPHVLQSLASQVAAACSAALLLGSALGSQLAVGGPAAYAVVDRRGPDSGPTELVAEQVLAPAGHAAQVSSAGLGSFHPIPYGDDTPLVDDLGLGTLVGAVQLDGGLSFGIGLGSFHPIPFGDDTPGEGTQDLSVPAAPLATHDVLPRRQLLPPANGVASIHEAAVAGLFGQVADRGVLPRRMVIVPPQAPAPYPVPAEVEGIVLQAVAFDAQGKQVAAGQGPVGPSGSQGLILPLPDGASIQILLRAVYLLEGGTVVVGSPASFALGSVGLE